MTSYSCVAARLTMRSVLQTQGDGRSRSCPFVVLVSRPFMALCCSPRRRRNELIICSYILVHPSSTRLVNPAAFDRHRKGQQERTVSKRQALHDKGGSRDEPHERTCDRPGRRADGKRRERPAQARGASQPGCAGPA